jgi:hypothetical protein
MQAIPAPLHTSHADVGAPQKLTPIGDAGVPHVLSSMLSTLVENRRSSPSMPMIALFCSAVHRLDVFEASALPTGAASRTS